MECEAAGNVPPGEADIRWSRTLMLCWITLHHCCFSIKKPHDFLILIYFQGAIFLLMLKQITTNLAA